jgi:hypothetical protein
MNIQRMSDRKLEMEKKMLIEWIHFPSLEEEQSGEVDDWRKSLELIYAEIKQRQEQGKETR